MLYLCQCLYAGVDVTTCHLRDDKVDGGGRAVVQVIKVWRDRAHPLYTEAQAILVTTNLNFYVCFNKI